MKFRKKPVEVEAWRWTGRSLADLARFVEENNLPKNWCISSIRGRAGISVVTLSGHMQALRGDWIVRYPDGGYTVCGQDSFESMYEPVPLEHDVNSIDCWCDPDVQVQPDGSRVVVHRREQ